MTWACMAANGTGSPVFDVMTADRNNKMSSEMYTAILSIKLTG